MIRRKSLGPQKSKNSFFHAFFFPLKITLHSIKPIKLSQGLDDAIADIHKEPTPGPRDSRDSLNITIFVAESPHLLSLE
jgi:hypothetical protein